MVDSEGYRAVDSMAQQTKRAAARGMHAQATLLWSQTEQVISRAAQGVSFYNIMDKIPSSRSRALRQAAQQAAQTGNHTGQSPARGRGSNTSAVSFCSLSYESQDAGGVPRPTMPCFQRCRFDIVSK